MVSGWRSAAELVRSWCAGWPGVLAVLAALNSLAYFHWQLFRWGGDENKTLIGDAFILPVNLGAVVLAWAIARNQALSRRERLAWRIVAAAYLSYLAGNALFFYFESVLKVEPFPSWADAGFLGFYPLMLAGLLSFPHVLRNPSEKLMFWLDTATVLVGGSMVIWHFVLRPTATAADSDPFTTALLVGYLIGDLILLLGIATILLRRTSAATRGALYLLIGGLVCFFVADFGFAYLSLQKAYEGGDWPDIFYYLAVWLMLESAHFQHWYGRRTARLEAPQATGTRFSWLPYLSVALGYGLLVVVSQGRWVEPLGELVIGAVALTGLVVARQIASARENTRLLAEIEARRGEARLGSLVRNASDLILITDSEGTVRYETPSVARVLDPPGGTLIGKPLTRLLHPQDHARARAYFGQLLREPGGGGSTEWRLPRGDDSWIQAEVIGANLVDDPNVEGIVLNLRDVSERKLFEEQLAHQAFHDALTGLANRALFGDRVEHALDRVRRGTEQVAVMILDLDDFKLVNDTLGHGAGDRLLVQVGERLRDCLRPGDTPARLGGDEFAVLLDGITDPADAELVARRIVAAMGEPFALDGRELSVGASVGLAVQTSRRQGTEELLRNADLALYSAKNGGKGSSAVFEDRMLQAVVERVSLRDDLQRALERDELRAYYQPIVALESGAIVGAETLVRWAHPRRGLVAPAEFIPLAEESGLILPIGRWVLREAARQARAWQTGLGWPDGRRFRVSVNLSPLQMQAPGLIAVVEQTLAETGLPPCDLVLEITETLLMQHSSAALRKLHGLKSLGVQLAIDDFGTGYSSLSYLRQFPIDVLKVDKSFVDELGADRKARALVGAIAELARALELKIVAEGIESERQRGVLEQLGCDFGQGYLFARPMPAESFGELLARQAAGRWAGAERAA